MVTANPLLLSLRTLAPEQLLLKDREAAVSAIESWTMRRMITGANSRGYGSFFVDVLTSGRTTAEAGDNVADTIVSALHGSPQV